MSDTTNKVNKVATIGGLAAIIALPFNAMAAESGWTQFKANFVSSDGRIVDTHQGNISHSEGQGYGMLLAVYNDDRAAFEQIWRWTHKNLQVRNDYLLAWEWKPGYGVADRNNASDGDLLVAWSLLRAYNRWHVPDYLEASREIAQDIRKELLRNTPQGLILLPGIEGFDKPDGITINLSYWVFPAIDEIGQADPSPDWGKLSDTGIRILQYARFGRWGLPPDWLILTQKVGPSDKISDRFGYNAVRIPLYLLWSHRETDKLLKPYREFWEYFSGAKFLPAWTDLKNDCVDSYDASAGIHMLAQWVLNYPNPPTRMNAPIDEKGGYYSSVLLMLTQMAVDEHSQRLKH